MTAGMSAGMTRAGSAGNLWRVKAGVLAAVGLTFGLWMGSCTDDGDSSQESVSSTTTIAVTTEQEPLLTEEVTLVVGHCYIEPLRRVGLDWIEADTALGTGGDQPENFSGTGTFTIVSQTAATFTDELGLVVAFKPDDGTPRGCR